MAEPFIILIFECGVRDFVAGALLLIDIPDRFGEESARERPNRLLHSTFHRVMALTSKIAHRIIFAFSQAAPFMFSIRHFFVDCCTLSVFLGSA